MWPRFSCPPDSLHTIFTRPCGCHPITQSHRPNMRRVSRNEKNTYCPLPHRPQGDFQHGCVRVCKILCCTWPRWLKGACARVRLADDMCSALLQTVEFSAYYCVWVFGAVMLCTIWRHLVVFLIKSTCVRVKKPASRHTYLQKPPPHTANSPIRNRRDTICVWSSAECVTHIFRVASRLQPEERLCVFRLQADTRARSEFIEHIFVA